MIRIYFDEAGNTGHDLLNKEQPMYVLSSTKIDEKTSKDILECNFKNISQLHFKKKRLSNKGKQEILSFWIKNFTYLNQEFKSMLIDKKYMIICQILDYILEPYLYENHIDYYDGGMNITYANMVYFGLSYFCPLGLVKRLYKSFINMFKIANGKSIIEFYKILDLCASKSTNKEFKEILLLLKLPINQIIATISTINKDVLDPAIHSLIFLITSWNDQLEDSFEIFHDRSNSVLRQKKLIDFLMQIKCPKTEIGYGNFKSTYPLKIKRMEFISSENYSIKLCDIVSSSLLYAYIRRDSFAVDLRNILEKWYFTNQIVPTTNTNIIEERKKQVGDIESHDFFVKQIMKKKVKYQNYST